MKVGRGLFSPTSRSHRKCTPLGHSPFFYTSVLIVVALSVILAGCGNISLSELLVKQAPGELGISPQTATIDDSSTIEIKGKGGFTPYTFSANEGSIEVIDGLTYFTAPNFATDVTITVMDSLSSVVTATIHVVSSTGLSFPAAMTIAIGENTGFVIATGGTGSYTFWLEGDGSLDYHHLLLDRVKYIAPEFATTAKVWVEDSGGTQRTLTITIVEEIVN